MGEKRGYSSDLDTGKFHVGDVGSKVSSIRPMQLERHGPGGQLCVKGGKEMHEVVVQLAVEIVCSRPRRRVEDSLQGPAA